jgi:hypothetical protein
MEQALFSMILTRASSAEQVHLPIYRVVMDPAAVVQAVVPAVVVRVMMVPVATIPMTAVTAAMETETMMTIEMVAMVVVVMTMETMTATTNHPGPAEHRENRLSASSFSLKNILRK